MHWMIVCQIFNVDFMIFPNMSSEHKNMWLFCFLVSSTTPVVLVDSD